MTKNTTKQKKSNTTSKNSLKKDAKTKHHQTSKHQRDDKTKSMNIQEDWQTLTPKQAGPTGGMVTSARQPLNLNYIYNQ